MPTTFRKSHVLVASACVLALVACSVESEPEPDDENASAVAALGGSKNGSKNGSLGFTCENGYCVCDKLIEGDCDKMLKNCSAISLPKLDKCLSNWKKTYCACSMGLVATPDHNGGVVGGGGADATP